MGAQIPGPRGNFEVEEGAAHCKVWGLSTVSPAKMTEPIEMQFRMLSQVSPGNSVRRGCTLAQPAEYN